MNSEQEIFEHEDIIEEDNIVSYLDTFLKEIESCVDSSAVGDRLNAYYVPDFKTCLMRICKKFPMWSNVMVSFFKSPYITASSASVEGEFSQLKNSILKHESRLLSADRFVVTPLRSLENSMKIVRSEQLYPTKTTSSSVTVPEISSVDICLDKIIPRSETTTVFNNSELILNDNNIISSVENMTSSSSTNSLSDDDTFNAEECWGGLKSIRTGPLLNSDKKKKKTQAK